MAHKCWLKTSKHWVVGWLSQSATHLWNCEFSMLKCWLLIHGNRMTRMLKSINTNLVDSLLASMNTSLAVTSDAMSCSLTLGTSLLWRISNMLCPMSSLWWQLIKLLTDSDTYRNLPLSQAITNKKQSAFWKQQTNKNFMEGHTYTQKVIRYLWGILK